MNLPHFSNQFLVDLLCGILILRSFFFVLALPLMDLFEPYDVGSVVPWSEERLIVQASFVSSFIPWRCFVVVISPLLRESSWYECFPAASGRAPSCVLVNCEFSRLELRLPPLILPDLALAIGFSPVI